MIPNPRVSKRTVANMNARAALLAPVFVSVSALGGSWVSSVKLLTLILDIYCSNMLELLSAVEHDRPLLQVSRVKEAVCPTLQNGLTDARFRCDYLVCRMTFHFLGGLSAFRVGLTVHSIC